MGSEPLIAASEYLTTTYRPDCDFVDGEVRERNVGELGHSAMQAILLSVFHANRSVWGVTAFPELRVQVAPERFRIPDITVLRRSDPKTPIVRMAPLVCIEILSPEDRIQRLQERIRDYVRMGVEHIWLLDPETRDAWIALPDGSHRHVSTEFSVPATPIRLGLAEIFAELEEMRTQF